MSRLKQERAEWQRRVKLLKSASIDPDTLDERARAVLNYLDPRELTLMLKPALTGGPQASTAEPGRSEDRFSVQIACAAASSRTCATPPYAFASADLRYGIEGRRSTATCPRRAMAVAKDKAQPAAARRPAA